MEKTNFDKILPNGSVVKLNIMKKEHADENFLIVKRFVTEKAEDKFYYEYEGMLLPTGTKDGKNIMFNSEHIAQEVFRGYSDEKEEAFIQSMKEIILETKAQKKERK